MEGLPSHEAFYSNLKKTNISEDEYNLVKQTWQENNWQTLRDLLIFYNMIDVGPFVEAITKMRADVFFTDAENVIRIEIQMGI